MSRRILAGASLLLSLGLAGCWGLASIGGSLTGLPAGTSVTLQNNGADNLTLSANGRFEFGDTLNEGDAYSVTVLTQPNGATCTVSNGSGSISADGRDITNVLVTCVVSASIKGSVSGLIDGTNVTLTNSGPAGGSTTVTTNGAFSIGDIRPNGEAYDVRVTRNPLGSNCTVTDGVGTVTLGTDVNITVNCVGL